MGQKSFNAHQKIIKLLAFIKVKIIAIFPLQNKVSKKKDVSSLAYRTKNKFNTMNIVHIENNKYLLNGIGTMDGGN